MGNTSVSTQTNSQNLPSARNRGIGYFASSILLSPVSSINRAPTESPSYRGLKNREPDRLNPMNFYDLTITRPPHGDMRHKVKFTVGNPCVSTRANVQNLPSHRKSGIGHIYSLLFSAMFLSVDKAQTESLTEDREI